MPHTDPSEGPIEEDLLLGTEPEAPLSGNRPQINNSRKRRSCNKNPASPVKKIGKKLRNDTARVGEVEEVTQNNEVSDIMMNDTVSNNDATATVCTTNVTVEEESEFVDASLIEEIEKSGYRDNNPMRNQINYNNKTYNYIKRNRTNPLVDKQIVFYYVCRAKQTVKQCGASMHICYENEEARSNKRFTAKTGRNKHICGESQGPTKINCTTHRDLTKDMYLKMSQASMLPSNATKGPQELAMEIMLQFMNDNAGKFKTIQLIQVTYLTFS